MIDPIIQRLSADVPALTGRVKGAMDFGRLVEAGQVPPVTPAAFVLPAGIHGGKPVAVTGAFVQDTEEMVSVMLALRVHEVTGQAGIDPLKALIDAVLVSLCGWAPVPDAQDVLRLLRGALVSLTAGLVVYQLDFAITDQLRIAR